MSFNNVKSFIDKCPNPALYNFDNECDIDEYISLPTIDKYFVYKSINKNLKNSVYENGKKFASDIQNNPKYKSLGDCDGSSPKGNISLIHDIYKILWGWNKDDETTFGKVDEKILPGKFGGDTMNSMQTVLNIIVEDIIAKTQNKTLIEQKNGQISIRYMLELYANKKTKKLFLDNLSEIKGLYEYADIYHTIGNFCLVPAYFNKFRGCNSTIKDNWPLSLEYLRKNGWEKDFNYKGKEIQKYYKYINCFFLWDYIGEEGNSLEIKENDYHIYMSTMMQKILKRGHFMIMMLKLYIYLGEQEYQKFYNAIFLRNDKIYLNYQTVFNYIEKYFSKSKKKEVLEIISSAKDSIIHKQII